MSGEVTDITLLPVSLSLVHVPRSRIPRLFHPIVKQLLVPEPTFLNVTCNEIELSIFAADSALDDFLPIVAADERRLARFRRRGLAAKSFDPVEVSEERWKVLQIGSPDDSGVRVQELSSPMADAGISILYQSSHQSDFILVKESRLQDVMTLLGGAGFHLYAPHSDDGSTYDPYTDTSPSSGAVLTRTHSSNNSPAARTRSNTSSSLSSLAERLRGASTSRPSSPPDVRAALPRSDSDQTTTGEVPPAIPRQLSHGPSMHDVRILKPDMTCVGLRDDYSDRWLARIIKLVAFPALIDPSLAAPPAVAARKPFLPAGDRALDTDSPFHDFDAHGTKDNSFSVDDVDLDSDSDSSSPPSSEEDEDVLSSSPLAMSMPSLSSTPPATAAACCKRCGAALRAPGHSCSCPDLTAGATVRPRLDRLTTITPPSASGARAPTNGASAGPALRPHTPRAAPAVPFFSFTRAPEGTSLTTSIALLAALFPRADREMISCGDELDVYDEAAAARARARLGAGARVGLGLGLGSLSPDADDDEDEADADADGEYESEDEALAVDEPGDRDAGGAKKCLQVDLRGFGLDKHGLVNRFSRVLEGHRIEHMYSSTYKTANLLVDKRNARKAQRLLRRC